MEIVDYIIIRGFALQMIEQQVRNKLKEGYQPFGSLAANESVLLQPMVKYKNEVRKRV